MLSNPSHRILTLGHPPGRQNMEKHSNLVEDEVTHPKVDREKEAKLLQNQLLRVLYLQVHVQLWDRYIFMWKMV